MMKQRLNAGRDYATKKLKEHAHKANVPIDDASWHDNGDVSYLVVESRGKREVYEIENPLLEDDQRRDYLDQLMERIVKEVKDFP